MGASKPITKGDDSGKEFIIDCLGGDQTRGGDVDSLYFDGRTNEWVIIELLCCDSVKPMDSHPHRYWYNWKKFANLWALRCTLGAARLYLVNYRPGCDDVKVIRVDAMNPASKQDGGGITAEVEQRWTRAMFSSWFRELNDSAGNPWEHVPSDTDPVSP